MNIKQAIATINQMQKDGVIETYAVGGAVAATQYVRPFATEDLDIFIEISVDTLIVTLKPIYDYLLALGCYWDGEYIVVSGCKVQFLIAPTPLVREAVEHAVEKDIGDGVVARIFTAEHLAAIALETGRRKDHDRLSQFCANTGFDLQKFTALLERYNLRNRMDKFRSDYDEQQ